MKRVILFAQFWTFLTKVFYFHIRDSFLGDIAEKWFRLLVFMLLFHGLFVCLSVCVTFVHSAQMAEDIDTVSFAYNSPMSHPDHVKIWLTLVNPFLKFCHKVTQPDEKLQPYG